MKSSKLCYSFALGLPLLGSATAADLAVKLEIPRLNVAEYHKPFVALWIEKGDQTFVSNLTVWYERPKGDRYLKDVRQWWRQSGRDMKLPLDGISTATRAPGEYDLKFAGANSPLDKLAPGDYQLVVEAAREQGGREVVRIPFQWPVKAEQSLDGKGKEELGAVSLQIKP